MLLLLLLVLSPADAGRRKRNEPPPAPAPPPPKPLSETPWVSGLVVPLGPLPAGLANPTAAGCAACHTDPYQAWTAGAHGGPPPGTIAALSPEEGCTGCHLPLVEQRPRTGSFGFGTEQPPSAPQPFSATLWEEGVGCAACHVVDGSVLAARHVDDAPHAVVGSGTLGGAEGCATCHQLEVDGVVWYDTYTSWEASPYAAAGVACRDCHAPHGQKAGPGVSLLVDLPTDSLTRGGAPIAASVVVQNTGAGHSWPSSGPYSGVELVVRLVGPLDEDGRPTEAARFATPLARRLGSDGQPASDTRLPPMGSASFPVELALDQQAPAGPWHLEVALRRTTLADPVAGEDTAPDGPYEDAVPRVWMPLSVD